jgi:hypothetical protein
MKSIALSIVALLLVLGMVVPKITHADQIVVTDYTQGDWGLCFCNDASIPSQTWTTVDFTGHLPPHAKAVFIAGQVNLFQFNGGHDQTFVFHWRPPGAAGDFLYNLTGPGTAPLTQDWLGAWCPVANNKIDVWWEQLGEATGRARAVFTFCVQAVTVSARRATTLDEGDQPEARD